MPVPLTGVMNVTEKDSRGNTGMNSTELLMSNKFFIPEGNMLNTEASPNRWKTEQLTYFREYIKAFKPGSAEYKRIAHDIRELEKHN